MPPSSNGVSVATLTATVTADTSDLESGLSKASGDIESFGGKVNGATSSAKDFGAASGVMATGAVGIAAGLAASAMAAGDFQASINEIGVVTGATADELQGLSDLALKIGKDTAFSAQEGAAAITELGKAGIGITDIMSGAAEATAALAGAGGVDMARAAQVMSAAMNIFQIEGSKSAEVADILAAGANASASSVDDLANGFSNAGPAAAALGMDLDDTVAVLALLADRGLSGAEAGTQLRGVLTSLTPKTKPAVEAFAELGLAVGESGNAFFDASGKFVGMEQASATLYDALKDLTDQQRAQALETIFGTYNAGAAETMFQAQKAAVEGTGKGYADYNKEVQAAGQATDVANAKMDGMNGAIMALQGSIETAQIVIGMQFVGAIEAAAEFLSTLVNAFLALPEPVQTAIAGVAAGAAAFLAVGSAIGFIIGPLGAFVAALAPLAAGIVAIAAPLALVVAGIAALYVAYTTNFLGFADGVNAAVGTVVAAVQSLGETFTSIKDRATELMGAGFTPLQAAVRALREEFPAFSGAIATVGTLFQNLLNTVQGVAAGLMSAFDALRNGDLSGVFQGLLAAGQAAVTGLLNHFTILGEGILQAFNAINWSAISATLQVGLQNASTALQTWFGTISQNLQTWFTSIDWGVIGGMLSTGLQSAISAMGDVASLLLTKGAELISGLSTGFAQAWPTVSAWLATVPVLIGAAMSAAGDVGILLLQKGVEIITGLLTGFQQKWPEVQTWIGTAFTELGPTITTAMATVTTAASAAWDTMKTDATTKIEELKTEVLGKWDTLRTEIVNKVTDLQTTLASTFDSLKVDIPAKVTELVTNATTQFETLKTDATAKMTELQTSVTDAIETLKTQAIAKVEELQTSATESFTSLKTEAVQLITDLGLEALAQFEILKTNAIAKVEELKTGFVNKLNEMKTEAITAVTGIKDGIIAVFADAGTWLVSAGQAIGQGLINGLGSMKDAVGNAAGELGANATSAVTGLLGIRSPSKVFHEIGVDTAQGFANGIEAGEGAVAQAVAALIERITGVVADRLGALNGDLSEGGRRAGKSVVDGMNDATGDISDYEVGSAEWRQALQNKITAGMDKVGKKVGDDVNTGVKSKKADHQKAMGEFLDAGVNYGLDKADDATDIGVRAANAMRQGLTSGQQDLVTTAGKIATQVIDEFGSHLQEMYDIGRNYMEGFALGMRAGAGEVEDAANDIGKSAEKELRKATESASPSKAAFRVGQDVGRGFADGISSTEDLSRKAARKLWRAAWKELKDSIKEGGFLGRDWAVEFWQGMLNSPDMTGPLAAWITDQMVAAADTALKKTQALIAGIAAQLDIARGLVGAPSSIPEVPQPEAVDTSNRDMLQKQLDATRDLTDAITKAFESAFSAAHKAHIDFVQGTISEGDYLAKYQAAQEAFNAKNANARQAEALETQVKAAQAAIDAETAARQKAYDQAVKDREAAVAAEDAARRAAVAQLEQAQRDAQMQMTQDVISEANQRIAQYEKEIKKASDPRERAELKAKMALERERIDVANQLAAAITAANNATSDFDLAKANAQIDYFTAQLEALGQVDVGGMLQGIADAMLEAANKIAQAADKMKHAFGGGGGGGKKDKLGGTQDASDPSISGGGMDSVVQQFDRGGKAARKFGDDVNSGSGVAARAIDDLVKRGVISLDTLGAAGGKAGKKMTDGVATAVAQGETHMTKQVDKSVEAATVNGEKIGHDRGKSIGVTITSSMEDGVTSRERNVTKTIDGVVTQSTKSAEKPAKTGGQNVGDQFIYWTSNAVEKGDGDVRRAAKGVMDGAGQEAKKDAHRLGNAAGDDLGRGMADGIRGRKGDVERAARELADAADRASRKKSESRSPSRVWMRHGHDMGDGLIIGLHDRTGDAQEAARALIYTPKGLPGGGIGNSNSASGPVGKRAGGDTIININNPTFPNVVHPEDFWPAIQNELRTISVSSGRG